MKKLIFLFIIITVLTVGCAAKNNVIQKQPFNLAPLASNPLQNNALGVNNIIDDDFAGKKGEEVKLSDNKIILESGNFNDGSAHFYNIKLPDGKRVYFFVVKDKNGIYRAAANSCQVCHGSKVGFRQEGDKMVCGTCGNSYPMEKIAAEKGGCNPGPINQNLSVENGKIAIELSDLEQVVNLF